MNKVLLTGRLTRDPELRSLASGSSVATFAVATNEFRGNGKERAEYHNVVVWDRLAEVCGQYLGKGQQVALSRAGSRRASGTTTAARATGRPKSSPRSVEMLSGRRKRDYEAESLAAGRPPRRPTPTIGISPNEAAEVGVRRCGGRSRRAARPTRTRSSSWPSRSNPGARPRSPPGRPRPNSLAESGPCAAQVRRRHESGDAPAPAADRRFRRRPVPRRGSVPRRRGPRRGSSPARRRRPRMPAQRAATASRHRGHADGVGPEAPEHPNLGRGLVARARAGTRTRPRPWPRPPHRRRRGVAPAARASQTRGHVGETRPRSSALAPMSGDRPVRLRWSAMTMSVPARVFRD